MMLKGICYCIFLFIYFFLVFRYFFGYFLSNLDTLASSDVWIKKWGKNGTFCLTCFWNFVIVLLINFFQTENFTFWGAHRWKFNSAKFYDHWL